MTFYLLYNTVCLPPIIYFS